METIDDPEIKELKELVKRQGVIIEDMSRTVHGMRRSQRWHSLLRIVWWLLIFGASAGAYYFYIQPYLEGILHAYQQVQHGAEQAQNFPQMLADILKKMFEQIASFSKPQ
jgi:hypothetical protein